MVEDLVELAKTLDANAKVPREGAKILSGLEAKAARMDAGLLETGAFSLRNHEEIVRFAEELADRSKSLSKPEGEAFVAKTMEEITSLIELCGVRVGTEPAWRRALEVLKERMPPGYGVEVFLSPPAAGRPGAPSLAKSEAAQGIAEALGALEAKIDTYGTYNLNSADQLWAWMKNDVAQLKETIKANGRSPRSKEKLMRALADETELPVEQNALIQLRHGDEIATFARHHGEELPADEQLASIDRAMKAIVEGPDVSGPRLGTEAAWRAALQVLKARRSVLAQP